MRQYNRVRIVFWSAIVVISIAGVAGPGPGLAQKAALATSALPAARPADASNAAGTVVRLHQHVVRVSILNFAFQPARLVVSPGTRVVWTNRDSDPHTVTSSKGLWASEALDTDSQFAHVFTKAGTFTYYCAIHPYMHGTIIVKR